MKSQSFSEESSRVLFSVNFAEAKIIDILHQNKVKRSYFLASWNFILWPTFTELTDVSSKDQENKIF